jgi:hypothetical protein
MSVPLAAIPLPARARRAAAMVIAFTAAAPPVNAIVYLGIYASAKRLAFGVWDVPTLREFVEYLPDIYTFGTAAALLTGLIFGWRQTRREGASPVLVVAVGAAVGFANAAVLLALAPDFGLREVPVSVLMACHTVAFVPTTIICWRIGDLLGRAAAGARA